MQERTLAEVITPILADHGLELDALHVTRAGKRNVVRVTVDGDGPEGRGPLLDDIAEASQAVSTALDASPAAGNAPYTLELSSRGVSAPLTEAKHYRRNTGRLVRLTIGDEQVTGRITGVEDDEVELEVDGAPVRHPLASIDKAQVQIEMQRKGA